MTYSYYSDSYTQEHFIRDGFRPLLLGGSIFCHVVPFTVGGYGQGDGFHGNVKLGLSMLTACKLFMSCVWAYLLILRVI